SRQLALLASQFTLSPPELALLASQFSLLVPDLSLPNTRLRLEPPHLALQPTKLRLQFPSSLCVAPVACSSFIRARTSSSCGVMSCIFTFTSSIWLPSASCCFPSSSC